MRVGVKRKKNKLSSSGIRIAVICPILFLLVLILDQATKYYVHGYIPRMYHENQWYPYNGIGVFPDFLGVEFSIVHAINKGAAWGIGSDFQDYLIFLRIVFTIGLIFYALFFNKNSLYAPPLALITAGAMGNICDYFIYGHVVDMLHVVLWGWDYPVFNIADSAIFIGICYVFIISWTLQREPKKSKN